MGVPVWNTFHLQPYSLRALQLGSVALCFTCSLFLAVAGTCNWRWYQRWVFAGEAVYIYGAISIFVIFVHILPLGGSIQMFFQGRVEKGVACLGRCGPSWGEAGVSDRFVPQPVRLAYCQNPPRQVQLLTTLTCS